MKFKIYQRLFELSQELHSDTDDPFMNYHICWKKASQVAEAITTDIQSITSERCYVTDVRFFLEDSTFRQGASSCILEVKFDQEEEFTITSECLIDHGRVMLRVKQRPTNRRYEAIAQLIEAKYGSEWTADLKEFDK